MESSDLQKVFVGCGKIFLGNCKKELYIWEEVYIMKKNKKLIVQKKWTIKQI